jgi:hypothetical protein
MADNTQTEPAGIASEQGTRGVDARFLNSHFWRVIPALGAPAMDFCH